MTLGTRLEIARHWGPLAVRLLGIAFSALAILILIASVDVSAALRAMSAANLGLIAAAVVIVLLQLVVVSLRWSILLPEPRYSVRLPWHAMVRPVALGYLGNFVLPARLGEVLRAAFVSRRWGIPFAPTFGSVVLERVIDTSVLALIAVVAAVLVGAAAWVQQVAMLAAAVGCIVLALLASGLATAVSRHIDRRAPQSLRKPAQALSDFLAGASAHRRGGAILAAAFLSAATWLLEGMVYWMVANAVGASVGIESAILVAGITVLATAVPSAPAYIGTYELAVTAVAGALGVPAAIGLAWALVAHVVTVAPLMAAGAVALLTSDVDWREASAPVER